MALPKTRRAYCYDPNSKQSSWQDIPIPDLPENFILVKVATSHIQPLDIALLQGAPFAGFGIGPGPHILGSTGAGTVVAHGPGKGAAFLNKKVSMMPSRPGCWADYAVIHINDCIILPDTCPWEEAPSAMNSSLTGLMFLAMARKMGAKAVVNTAGNSCIGRIVSRLLQANGIEVINLVRKPEKAAQIAAEGARNILNIADQDWEKRYMEICMKTQATLVLDSVGGEFFTKIAAISPPGTTLCVYGSLSSPAPIAAITHGDLFQGKVLIGATVFQFWATLHSEEKVKQVDAVVSQLSTTFKLPVAKVFSFTAINDAIKFDAENRSAKTSVDGRVCLKW